MLDGSSPSMGSSPSIPNKVGVYQILSLIGKGGMGTVYRGRHRSQPMAERQGGDVCIKTMHPQYADDQTYQRRFEQEAALGMNLDHPGLVKVHDLVMDAETLALVMEYVEGRSLADMIGHETGPIPWARAWPMFKQLLEAVGYAHEHGIIHRDLKPENVMVTSDGQLKVLDLGIAKEAGSGATRTGSGMGTADYMAPEQHTDAKNVDERADIYALGMTLYEMLAGRLPWGDELDMLGVLLHKQSGHIPPPTAFYPDIPHDVVAVVMSALLPDRMVRPGNVSAFGRALEGAEKTLPGTSDAPFGSVVIRPQPTLSSATPSTPQAPQPQITPTSILQNPTAPQNSMSGEDVKGRYQIGDTNFSGLNLCKVNLSGAFLTKANFANADLSGASLTKADFSWGTFNNADFTRADLRGADLYGADLTGADLSETDLREADFPEANLTGAILRKANLAGADLRGANLTEAILTGADLRGAHYDTESKLPSGINPTAAGMKKWSD